MRWGRTWARPVLLSAGWAAGVALGYPPAAIGATGALTGIRHFASPAHTRVVLDLSGGAEPTVSAVPLPSDGPVRRIYVDLPGARVTAGVKRVMSFREGPLSGVRVGRTDPSTVRVAILVREHAIYEVSRLDPPFRLVVDVRVPRRTDAPPARSPSGTPGAAGQRGTGHGLGQPPAGRTPRNAADLRAPARRETFKRGAAGITIVLDPGHGGKDPGASGIRGVKEKDVVLAIARRLAARIEDTIGARVVLTRERDEFLSLEARTALANAAGADLFVSIHANASAQQSTSGVETYYLNNTDNRATIRLAAMENGLTLPGAPPRGGDLSYILSDLVQRGKLEDSMALSRTVHHGLLGRLRHANPGVVDLGVKEGPFYVLVGAYMPCVLVEVAFLTHPEEGRLLGTAAYQNAIADGLLDGIGAYVAQIRRARTL
jgi:N-acetylmuramoyl-L-alanine amidase